MYSQLLRATLLLIFGIRKGLADDGLDSRSAGWMVVRAYREIAQHATIQVFINKEYGFCGEHYLVLSQVLLSLVPPLVILPPASPNWKRRESIKR